jgi:toxin secretion/phage lysis holin
VSKENVVQGIIALIIAGVSAYFQIIAIPLLVLMVVMVTDYITGMTSAYIRKEFSSKVGIIGAVKKVSYIALVCVGICADYLIHTALTQLGVQLNIQLLFGLLVTIWLIINELISILENLSKIGVPMPGFLMKLVEKLKITVESKADNKIE